MENAQTQQSREFDAFCKRLRRNGILRDDRCMDIASDRCAFQLAWSLMGNKSLESLTLEIWPEDVTKIGAQALGRGVQSSAVTTLTVVFLKDGEFSAAPTNCMWLFFSEAIPKLRVLDIRYDLQDTEAVKLGTLLRGNRLLRRLSLRLDFVTEAGALSLSKGIQKSTITHLEMTNASPEVCRVLLTSGIAKLRTLRHLDINNSPLFEDEEDAIRPNWSVFGGLTARSAATCLRQARTLETLKLSLCSLNDEDVKVVSVALRGNGNLKVLSLDGNSITDEGVSFLVKSCKGCWQLEELDLSQNQIGVAGFCELLKSTPSTDWRLKSLNLSLNPRIGREGLASMIDMDDHVDGISFRLPRKFISYDCDLTFADVQVLLSRKVCRKNLICLDLSGNHLGNNVADTLADVLSNGLMLEKLCLSSDELGTSGVQTLLKTTWTHPCLKVLGVSYNDVAYQGLALIAKDLSRSRLVEFTIRVNGDSRTATTPSAALDAAAQALVRAVKVNMCLQKLNLWGTDIPTKAKSDIQFFLDLDKYGRQLLRLDNGLHPFGLWSHVLAKCCNHASVLFYLLCEEPTLIPTFSNMSRREECSSNATADAVRKRQMPIAECGYVRAAKKSRELMFDFEY